MEGLIYIDFKKEYSIGVPDYRELSKIEIIEVGTSWKYIYRGDQLETSIRVDDILK